MILELPVRSDPQSYQFQITLEGEVYTLKFWYNGRRSLWYMSIKNADGSIDYVNGAPIFTNFPLLDRFRLTELPPGTMFVYDTEGGDEPPGQDDFGTRYKLLYVEAS